MQVSFFPEDVVTLQSVGSILAHYLYLAYAVYSKIHRVSRGDRLAQIEQYALGALWQSVSENLDYWSIISELANDLFGAEHCLIAIYDHLMMHFLPDGVMWRADQCIAGESFNYREVMWFSRETNLRLANQSDELYQTLGVVCERSVAFPLLIAGNMKGAIELVNPRVESLDDDAKALLAGLTSVLLELYLLIWAPQ
jgi:hypothetical protein